ncbi:MAG: phage tail tip lysozyme [Clostridium sp.]|nr:phage tail tip lysozyme [Clostridium sp.]
MTEEQIWDKLRSFGLNDFAVAGIMGNLSAESGLKADNLQNSGNRKLELTDAQYTAAVDNGTYPDFVSDGIGYGLAQWTYWSRKKALLGYATAAGTSIGDPGMQLDFFWKELQGYRSVMSALKAAASVREASDAMLLGYEKPKDQGENVRKKRALYGQAYYDRYAKGQTEAEQAAEGGRETMTESQVREKIVAVMRGWIGLKRADKSHAPIIDTYNGYTPLPRGYRVTYKDAYCAATVSAAAIKAGYTDIMPVECSCNRLIDLAKKMGIWQEDDAYVPAPGDAVLYDWDDNATNYATTDNKGAVEHVGMVEKVSGRTITIIEGNMNGGVVGRRTIAVNGRYIRGYICPKYATKASSASANTGAASGAVAGTVSASNSHKVGDVVKFSGSKHYKSANAASGSAARSGTAKITAISTGAKHPYHVVHTDSTSNVYGWVDMEDI